MQSTQGDIWSVSTPKDVIVIPTNIGWTSSGENVMGRGLALDAKRRWPHLPRFYGEHCREEASLGREVGPLILDMGACAGKRMWCRGLILFPVKPLNTAKPYLSWRQDADLQLIERGLPSLAGVVSMGIGWLEEALILVPSLGCGNGNLAEDAVVPLMEKHLTSNHFVHVRRK